MPAKNKDVELYVDKFNLEFANSGLSIKEWCEKENLPRATFDGWRKKHGGNMVVYAGSSIENPDNLEKQIVYGHLLGDGCLRKKHKRIADTRTFVVAGQYQEYIEWVAANTKHFINRNVTSGFVIDKRTGVRSNYAKVESRGSYWLYSILSDWYGTTPNKCVVPNDLVITPDLLLRWYIDDGQNQRGHLYLATQSFTRESCDLLCDKLLIVGIKSKLHKAGKKDQYKIFIPAESKLDFLSYIGDCPVSCYNYKWRN